LAEQEPKNSETTEPTANTKDESLLKLMRDRLDNSVENEKDERKKGPADTRFINGEQWEPDVIAQRGKKRLSLTINKLPASLDQIDGDIRLGTPTLKVKAVDDAADTDTADVLEGLIRYIQRNSRATKVHSYAGLHGAAGGRGAWRILTEYISDADFKQTIKIDRIINPYSVYYDPSAQRDDKQDGNYFFVVTEMSKEAYKNEYKFDPVDFEEDGTEFENWQSENSVKVAEYYYKKKVEERTIYQLESGEVIDRKPENDDALIQSRVVPVYKIKYAKVDGKRILETGDIPGKMFPVVLTWGKQLCVDGKLEVRGIARHSKDAQMLYNYFRSNDAEAAALQPKQPYLMPDICMTEEFKKVWDKANDENFPYLPYHLDLNMPGVKPDRAAPAMASSANQEQLAISDAEIRDTVGIQKAALGQESNETSGIAIQRRKQESDTGQFAYIDNLSDAIVTEGKIILGMIPEIFDYEAELRILGKDMKEKLIRVNDNGGIDFSTGLYDIDISTDGSYSTQREEFQDKINTILPLIPPEQVAVISDLLFEMQDFHRADDIANRLKKLLPPGLVEEEDAIDEEGGGITEQGMMPGQKQQLSPEEEMAAQQAQQEGQAQQAEIDMAEIKLEQEKVKLEGLRLKKMGSENG